MWKLLNVLKKSGNKKFGDITLTKAFTSVTGDNIYVWPESKPLPLERLAEMLKILDLIASGVDGELSDMYLDEALEITAKGLTDPKNAAKLSALLTTLKMRKSAFPHRDMLLNFCAIWLIHEDENPFVFDEVMHNTKIEMFTKDCNRHGSYFFFAMTGLGYISKWLTASEAEFTELLISANLQKQKLNQMLIYIKTQLGKH